MFQEEYTYVFSADKSYTRADEYLRTCFDERVHPWIGGLTREKLHKELDENKIPDYCHKVKPTADEIRLHEHLNNTEYVFGVGGHILIQYHLFSRINSICYTYKPGHLGNAHSEIKTDVSIEWDYHRNTTCEQDLNFLDPPTTTTTTTTTTFTRRTGFPD